MIALEPHPEGVVLPVKAQPGARKSEIKGEHGGALKIAVTQVAERGQANKALVELLSKRLRIAKSRIELLAGETSSQKRLLLRGISVDELRRKLEAE